MARQSLKQQVAPLWNFLESTFGMKAALNLYPPYMGAGIKTTHVSDDRQTIKVEMTLQLMNENYVGTHFGGSLYAMCDPFFMFILMANLGEDYIVWDQRPGTGTVSADFHIPSSRIEEIKDELKLKKKNTYIFEALVKNEALEDVARIEKYLYVRKNRK